MDRISLGTGNFKGMASIPFGIYLVVTNMVGLSTVASEKIFFYINFVVAGVSMYYLAYVIGLKRPWRIVSALFYMMNPVAIDFFRMFVAYGSAPLLLGLYINGLEQKKNSRYILFFALVWLFTTTYMYVDLSYAIIHVFTFFLYLFFYIFTHKDLKPAVQAVKFTAILLLFFVLLNAFWILPLGLNLSFEAQKAVVPGLSDEALYRGLSGTLLNVFRLLGYGEAGYLSTYKGDLIFQWAPWYFQSPTVLIGLLIPIIVFIPLLSRDRRRCLPFFGFLAIAGLFFVTGANPPLGELKVWLLERNPYVLTLFRNPLKFQVLIALSYAPLLGMGISTIYKFLLLKRHKIFPNLFVVIMCFILFGYYSFPYWTGSIFSKGGEVIPSARVKIPSYYSDAQEWLSYSNENSRILPLPMSKTYQSAYRWESGFFGPNPDRFLLDSPTIAHDDGSLAYQIPRIIGKETEDPKNDLSRFLGLLGVRYVILHRDTNWEYIKGHGEFFDTDLERLLVFIQQQSGLRLIKSFGQLDFYEISPEYILPHIYAINELTYIPKGFENFLSIIIDSEPPLRNAYFWDAIRFNRNKEKFNIVYLANEKNFSYPLVEQLSGFEKEPDLENWWASHNFEPDELSLVSTYVKEGNYSLRVFYNYSLGHAGGTINLRFDSDQNWNDFGKLSLWLYYPEIPPDNANVELILFDNSLNVLYRTQTNVNEKGWNPLTFRLTGQNLDNIKVLRFQSFDNSLNFKNMPLYLDDVRLEGPPLLEGEKYTDDIALLLPMNRVVHANINIQKSSAHAIGTRIFSQKEGTLRIKVDNQSLNITIPKTYANDSPWIWTAPMELNEGNHSIFVTSDVNIIIDMIIIKSFQNNINYSANTTINFERINPTKYIVHVQAPNPFFLVFSESYHKGWNAYIDGQQIPNEYHFFANGFANAWYINKTGTYTITLEFWPQKLFTIGSTISITTVILCVLYLSKNKIKTLYHYLEKKMRSQTSKQYYQE